MTYLRNVAKISLKTEKCIGCGICVNVCPHEVFIVNNRKAVLKYKDNCIECGACDKNCPFKAIEVKAGVG